MTYVPVALCRFGLNVWTVLYLTIGFGDGTEVGTALVSLHGVEPRRGGGVRAGLREGT